MRKVQSARCSANSITVRFEVFRHPLWSVILPLIVLIFPPAMYGEDKNKLDINQNNVATTAKNLLK